MTKIITCFITFSPSFQVCPTWVCLRWTVMAAALHTVTQDLSTITARPGIPRDTEEDQVRGDQSSGPCPSGMPVSLMYIIINFLTLIFVNMKCSENIFNRESAICLHKWNNIIVMYFVSLYLYQIFIKTKNYFHLPSPLLILLIWIFFPSILSCCFHLYF